VEDEMKQVTLYKNFQIHGESFQREKNGAWVPQYTLTRQDTATEKLDFPSHQYQFNHTFPTEFDADEFALHMAQAWVDKS
jgi:hypothetical protein